MPSVSDRIRDCREALGMSKTDLAKKTELTISAISQFESGERSPSLESLRSLADALGVTVDYLMGREEKGSERDAQVLFRGLGKLNNRDKEFMLELYQLLLGRKRHKNDKKQDK